MYKKDLLDQYKKNAINMADSGNLIVMLYEGAIRAIGTAKENMNFKTYDVVNQNLQKAIRIIDELRLSLDMKAGDIAEKLASIYTYMSERLTKANVDKDTAILDEITGLLEELLSSWKKIIKEGSGNIPDKPSGGKLDGGFSLKG